ncbi:SirA family protein [Escherichia coli]|uniref:SirA family protein n=1 Tax=Escherichia coli TaxID=562 RepID=A0A376KS38_ECOLX|nr:SirA family protein [Escherichia coli]
MKNIVPDYHLDMVGEPCPYPAVATLEAMPQLKKGEILEVVSDCPQSINNIPLDARITAIRCWIFSKTGRPFVI